MQSVEDKSSGHRWGTQLTGFRRAGKTSEKLGAGGIALGSALHGLCCLSTGSTTPQSSSLEHQNLASWVPSPSPVS